MTDTPADKATDPWARLRAATPARIGLGRVGAGLPTAAQMEFQFAHARARDAVHTPLDVAALTAELEDLAPITVTSDAPDRTTYLRRPDLGRRLAEADLPETGADVVFILADGLSSAALAAHGANVLRATLPKLDGLSIAPPVIATQARVALGDAIAAQMKARLVVTLIGERPGLTVADSLGAYITYGAKPGTPDSLRNCISNIHGRGGLTPDLAAHKIAWLVREALSRKLTGTGLKENAGLPAPAPAPKLQD
ncbi:ethanolamine ammonia-lyase subunit EutC [Pseudooceanicola sp. C21-150M6]|uniref:ethanolamine ammonia-lyase subunit EutC n=1 Tax=Pseudooceanicola sp. C21-150M6 TaxID=3434355 RepID=UPI003D7FABD7